MHSALALLLDLVQELGQVNLLVPQELYFLLSLLQLDLSAFLVTLLNSLDFRVELCHFVL